MRIGSRQRLHGKVRVAVAVGFGAALVLASLGRPASAEAERSLAGIKIFSRSIEVIRKYGNPTVIRAGALSTPLLSSGVVKAGVGGVSASSSGSTNGSGAQNGGESGQPSGGEGAPGELPGLGNGQPGGTPSEFGGGTGQPGGYGGGGTSVPAQPNPQDKQSTWFYSRPDGSTLEFTMSSDGRVVQIRETGFHGAARTSRGIGLGAKYSDVVARYGFPEHHNISGAFLDTNYSERFHSAFQFYDQRVVGIIVAATE